MAKIPMAAGQHWKGYKWQNTPMAKKHQWHNIPVAKNTNGKNINGKKDQWQNIQMAKYINGEIYQYEKKRNTKQLARNTNARKYGCNKIPMPKKYRCQK